MRSQIQSVLNLSFIFIHLGRIFPAGTDSRYLRELGISALGFSPMNNTPVLLHDHNEFLNETIFLKGIDIFEDIITEIGNVEHPAKNQ